MRGDDYEEKKNYDDIPKIPCYLRGELETHHFKNSITISR